LIVLKINDDGIYKFSIIENEVWEDLICKFKNKETTVDSIENIIYKISVKYNMDKKNIIKSFINYIIRNKQEIVNSDFLNFVENVTHSTNLSNSIYVHYALSRLSSFILS